MTSSYPITNLLPAPVICPSFRAGVDTSLVTIHHMYHIKRLRNAVFITAVIGILWTVIAAPTPYETRQYAIYTHSNP